MAIQVGEKIPDVRLKAPSEGGLKDVTTADLFSGRKVVLFAVPGAFTPLCSAKHLPGFVDKAEEIKAKGVDSIVCVAVNDAFVMGAWGESANAGGKVEMIADGNGELAVALGLDFDGSGIGFGLRSQRYAAIVNDGVIEHLAVEKPMKFEVSSAEAILEAL